MKVAIIKQLLDTFGPWSSIRWNETSPEGLFSIWPGRPLHWELTTLLEADWFIIPQQFNSDYTYDSVMRHQSGAEIVRKHTKRVVAPAEIAYDDYDLVITNDPILDFPRCSQTVFAYFVVEHWDRRYRTSLRRPLRNADLFLAHMMDASASLSDLPQAISFPYVRDPKSMRALFAPTERDEAVWADWRTLSFLSATTNGDCIEARKAAALRLEHTLQLPVAFRTFSMGLYHGEDPPRWGDAANFLRVLARQKYYLCLGRASGAGQGIADAASLGCICFGEQDKPYHRLLCHPEALCGDLQELPRRVRRVHASRDLQEAIRVWQDQKLEKHFIQDPLALLAEAIEWKRRRIARGVGQASEVEKEQAREKETDVVAHTRYTRTAF
ncbi:MAG TPA: hypothetical protein VJN93_12320 [Candidatus Acidoferrum sp.]|nr:hypothetical protein [Candidatus Acidoferrum sp.]